MEQDIQTAVSGREDTSRRRFLKWLLGILAIVNTFVAGIPFIGSLIGASSASRKNQWLKVASIGSLPEGQPAAIRFMSAPEDAYIHTTVLHSVWVVKHAPDAITVYSPICPHLGCYYQFSSDSDQFVCPCHGSVFSVDGKVLGGPSPRPLDTLQYKIENGDLYVIWERFKVGIPEKITEA